MEQEENWVQKLAAPSEGHKRQAKIPNMSRVKQNNAYRLRRAFLAAAKRQQGPQLMMERTLGYTKEHGDLRN